MRNIFLIIFFSFQFVYLLTNEQGLYAQNAKNTKLKAQLAEADNDTSRIKILNKLSKSYKRSNFDSALYFVKQAEKLAEMIDYSFGLADCYNNYGNIYKNQGYYFLAMNYYQKSLKISEELNYKKNLGKLYNNIGILHLIQKEYDLSMEYYEKSLKIKDELGDEKGKTYCYNNISTVYDIKKDYSKALEYINKSLAIRQKLKDSVGISVCYQFLGRIFLHKKDFEQSGKYYQLAMALKKESGDQFGIAQTLYNIAALKMAVGNSASGLTKKNKYYKQSINYAIQSLDISERIGALNVQRYAHNTLYEAYMALRNYKEAIMYKNSYDLLKDSLFSIEKVKQIKDIEAKYRFEKKQLQVEKLEKEYELKTANVKSLQNQRVLLIIILLLFVVVVLNLLFTRKKLKSHSQIIHKKNERINTQNEEITQQNFSLQKYQDHLEEMIKEQTESLIIAMENAKRADQLKTAFLENLSHEIRTPLNAIVGFSSLLESIGDLSEDDKKFVSHINSGSESLLKIIDSIMHVSKIQIGDFKISITKFSIRKLMLQLYEEFKVSDEYLKKSKLNLEINIEDYLEHKTVYSDENTIRTILFNLIENAIKYTEKGKVEFGFKLVSLSANKLDSKSLQSIQFYVKDTGIGINKDDVKYIFEKFRKIAPGKTKLYRGLGLGLTIAENMVKQLDGKIWLESELNKGTTFYFTIKEHLPPKNNNSSK